MRALLALALLGAPAAASRPITPPAPEFPGDAAWINAKPLSLERLRGRKAVVVAFLNLASINSVRAMPALRGWFDRYWAHDLMVIGVITPELEVQRDPRWAKAELERFGADFPLVLDRDRRIWNAYANEGWPALYLIDPKGRVVFDRLGEGGYREFEEHIRRQLSGFHSESALPPPLELADPPSRDCGAATKEVALGARRGAVRAHDLGDDLSRRIIIVSSAEGQVSFRGRWDQESDGLRLEEENPDLLNFVGVVYQGAQALAFLSPAAGKTTRFYVKQDDLWLHPGNAGGDVAFDEDGRSYVAADTPRLYDLSRAGGGSAAHNVALYPRHRGAAVRGFSFADACVVTRVR